MKGTIRRIMSGVLALSMSVAMAVPVFAEESLSDVEIKGSTVGATINVAASGDKAIIVNPYQLAVNVDSGEEDSNSEITDSIISKPVYITNSGSTAVEVSVVATGTATEGVTFATAALTAKDTTKKVYLYMMAGLAGSDDGTGDPSDWTDSTTGKARAYDKNTDVLISAKASSSKVAFTLAKDGTEFAEGTTSTIGAITLAGEACGNASTAWASTDTVSVTYAFTIRPTVIS